MEKEKLNPIDQAFETLKRERDAQIVAAQTEIKEICIRYNVRLEAVVTVGPDMLQKDVLIVSNMHIKHDQKTE